MELASAKKTEPTAIETFEEYEKLYFQRLLFVCKGNICEAVRVSGLARATIYRKIAYFKIQRPN